MGAQHGLHLLRISKDLAMLRTLSRLLSEGRRGLAPLAFHTSEAFLAPAAGTAGLNNLRNYAALPDPVHDSESEGNAAPIANLPSDGAPWLLDALTCIFTRLYDLELPVLAILAKVAIVRLWS